MGSGKHNAGSNPVMDHCSFASRRGLEIFLVASCYRNQDKLRPDALLGSYADFTLHVHCTYVDPSHLCQNYNCFFIYRDSAHMVLQSRNWQEITILIKNRLTAHKSLSVPLRNGTSSHVKEERGLSLNLSVWLSSMKSIFFMMTEGQCWSHLLPVPFGRLRPHKSWYGWLGWVPPYQITKMWQRLCAWILQRVCSSLITALGLFRWSSSILVSQRRNQWRDCRFVSIPTLKRSILITAQ